MQYMQGGAWQNEEKQIITLNFDERVTEILDQDWVGTSWVNDELTTYNYEGNVFPTKTIKEWDGSDCTLAVELPPQASGTGTLIPSVRRLVWAGKHQLSFHSNPKERQCQRMLKLLHNSTHLTCS